MVSQTVSLPNIRKLFIPDPGYIIVDADLKGADAQIVAWEADDESLKNIFKAGKDVHEENAKEIYGETNKVLRQKAKNGVHAVDYYVMKNTLAKTLDCSPSEAQDFIDFWLNSHPGIREWHERTRQQLLTNRTVTNIFGFRFHYFDRIINPQSGKVTPKALQDCLAWIGQSSTSIVAHKGMIAIHKHLPKVEILIQVHDSLVMQVPEDLFEETLPQIKSHMEILIPYPDPLTIPVSIKWSKESWGHC